MNTTKKQKRFSMKYCSDQGDHVVVMTTEQGNFKKQVCLSSHLCRAENKASCEHEKVFLAGSPVQTEENHFS